MLWPSQNIWTLIWYCNFFSLTCPIGRNVYEAHLFLPVGSNLQKQRPVWKRLLSTIFKVQSPKFQKSTFLVPSATSVIGMNYLYVDRAQKSVFSKMLRFRHQGYQIKALLKVDEEFQISDISKNHLRAENGMRNVSKFKFLAWISPFFHLKSKEFGFLPLL